MSSSNPSPHFEVIYKACHGLLFMSTVSGKILDVDPWVGPPLWFGFKGQMSSVRETQNGFLPHQMFSSETDWTRRRGGHLPSTCVERVGVEAGVSSLRQGPWKSNDWQTMCCLCWGGGGNGGAREIRGGAELFWNCTQICVALRSWGRAPKWQRGVLAVVKHRPDQAVY